MTDEMSLLLAACRPLPDPARLAALAARVTDAQTFMRLADRHRVGALVRHGFRRAGVEPPIGTASPLTVRANATAREGLVFAAETAKLGFALEAAGASTIVLKGAPLAILAHGTLATKAAHDIDLLVAPERLGTAAGVLAAAGYGRIGAAARVALAAWHGFAKDSVWFHPARGLTVELHTALTDFPHHLLPDLGIGSPTQTVTLAQGLEVRTFASEPLFAYLSVHGALSGWRRLKWLADLAGILGRLDAAEVARLHAAAGAAGTGRAATQAIVLAARLLGTPLPPEVARAMAADRWTRWLVDRAERLLTDPDGFDDPAERWFGTWPIHLMTAQLAPGPGYRRAILRRYLRADPGGPRRIPFPLVRAAERLTGPRS